MYRANLISVTLVRAIPGDLKPFVEFKATLKKMELRPDQRVAIFQIENTGSFLPVFLDGDTSIEDVKKELAEQEAEMFPAFEKVIEDHLKTLSGEKSK